MRVWVIVGVASALLAVGAPAASAERAPFDGSVSIEAIRPAIGDRPQTVVNCAQPGPCVVTANDGDVSQLTFRAGADFKKKVEITSFATGPGECGGTDCATAYNVHFDDKGKVSVAELIVLMSREDSTPPGDAAVFIDGVALTASCNSSVGNSPIPCANITRTGSGQTQYYVLFDADPAFKFR